MMKRSRWWLFIGTAAFLGVLLLVGSAFAQTPTPTPTPTKPRFNFADAFLTHLAQGLGIDKNRLIDQIRTAARATVDEAAQQGALTTDQAQRLKQRIDQATPEHLLHPFGKPFHGRPGWGRPGKFGDLWLAAAQKLGLTVDQLRAELRAGKSLAQIAQEKGVGRDDLKAALLQAARNRIQQAQQQGRLTQQQADQILSRLESQIDRLIDATPRPRHGQPPGPTPTPTPVPPRA